MYDNKKEDENKIPLYHHFEVPKIGKVHHFYIHGPIKEPNLYVDLIHTIRTSSEIDHILLHLNTEGGNVYTGIQIIGAMKQSKAHIITSMEGQVSSLGTLIFLSGVEYVIFDNSLMLIHNHTSSQYGKGHEYLSQAKATASWFEKIAKQIYKHFLTEAEIQHVIDGKDYWFDSDEVKTRLKKMTDKKKQKNDVK